jgi:molecular chaperone DnaK
VSAKDKATGKEQSIRIEGSNKLSDDEINRIKAEAEKYAEADKKAKEEADAINKGDALIIGQEKMIKEQEGNLTTEEKEKLQGFVSDLKEAVKDKNVDKINSLESSINETWQTISQRVYSQQQAQGGQQQNTEQSDFDAATASTENEEAQDAEFEEVK